MLIPKTILLVEDKAKDVELTLAIRGSGATGGALLGDPP